MANYESKMLTSCFEVENLEVFEAEFKKYSFEDLEISREPEVSKNAVILYGSDFSEVSYDFDYLDSANLTDDEYSDLEDETVDVFSVIQSHLKEDSVVIINSIGSERYRYVIGDSTLITKTDILFLNAEDAIKKLAVEKGLITQEQSQQLHCSN